MLHMSCFFFWKKSDLLLHSDWLSHLIEQQHLCFVLRVTTATFHAVYFMRASNTLRNFEHHRHQAACEKRLLAPLVSIYALLVNLSCAVMSTTEGGSSATSPSTPPSSSSATQSRPPNRIACLAVIAANVIVATFRFLVCYQST